MGYEIDEGELTERFVRASGPGGQNVNKTSSAVELRFDVAASPSLPPDVKRRLARLAGSRMTAEGVLIIFAQEHREQADNRRAARERLEALIEQASIRPKPRKKTRPTLASKTRRLEGKAKRAGVKAGRGRPRFD
ncbi:MAG: aminoacyl-tRNA hydrolase [Alphaproteobacteria bacterium]|nr:aminoacyl-tRNA hydrolase [Alphaproteobacteria bacterium]